MTGVPARLLVGTSALWVPLAFLGDGVTVLVLPLRLGADATTLGVVSFAGLAIGAAVQPAFGWLSDRIRGRVDRRAFIVAAALPAIAGMWLLAGTAAIAGAVIGYVVVQAAASAMQAGQQALIPEHVVRVAQGRAKGAKVAADVGGSFLAFLVLGIVLAGGALEPAAAVIGVVTVVAVGLLVAFVPRVAPVARSDAIATLPRGLVPLIAARFLFLAGSYAVGRFLLLLVAERLAIPTSGAADEAGGLLALFTLATAAAAIVVGWFADRVPRTQLMVAGALVASVGIVMLVPDLGVAGILAGGLTMAAGTALFVTANWAATASLVPAAGAGRLMGIANLGTALAAAVAGLAGPVIDAVGFAPALAIAAVASACAALPVSLGIVRGGRSAEEAA